MKPALLCVSRNARSGQISRCDGCALIVPPWLPLANGERCPWCGGTVTHEPLPEATKP